MGIKGLWAALREYTDDGHLSQFRGQRVAVDMYVWLHKCIHHCVRLRTEAVVAFFDAQHKAMGDAALQSSGADSPTSPSLALPVSLLSIHDVLAIDQQFLSSVIERVVALQRFGVIPVCVFDGAEMPMKSSTDDERQQRRTKAFQDALAFLKQLYLDVRRRRGGGGEAAQMNASAASPCMLPAGTPLYEEAVGHLEKAIDISPELAHAVIQVLKEEHHVECLVAPYEADAQLAYLCREGYVAAVASEDSDLIAYFCPCIISKLDTFSGKCSVLQPPRCAPLFFLSMSSSSSSAGAAALAHPAGSRLGKASTLEDSGRGVDGNTIHTRMRAAALQSSMAAAPISFSMGAAAADAKEGLPSAVPAGTFTYESFLLGCIMSGCDYVPNLRSIGVKKAFQLVARATSLRHCFLKLERDFGFPAEELARYRHRVLEAFYCFAHHLVYSPLTQEIVTFHALPGPHDGASAAPLKTQLVGLRWDAQTAQEVCVQCIKDPSTLQLYRGDFQGCATEYLRRLRRGQTSLKAFAAFQPMTSPRVVLHHSGATQGRLSRRLCSSADSVDAKGSTKKSGEAEDEEDFGPPLKKQCVATGFIGSGSSSGGGGAVVAESEALKAVPQQGNRQQPHYHHANSEASPSNGGASGGKVVVVRSRYFMMRGRTAVCTQWSASDAEDSENGVGSGDEGTSTSNAPADSSLTATSCENPFASFACLTSSVPVATGSTGSRGLADRPPRDSGSINSTAVLGSQAGSRSRGPGTRGKTMCEISDSPSTPDAGAETSPSSDLQGRDKTAADDDMETTCGSPEASAAARLSPRKGSGRLAEMDGGDSVAHARQQGTIQCSVVSPVEEHNVDSASAAVAAAPVCCKCPFGYWQCDRAHSVFESCFLGKQWSREAPPLSQASPSSLSEGSPGLLAESSPTDLGQQTGVNTRVMNSSSAGVSSYVPRAFRPPRSTATSSPSTAELHPR